MAHLCQCDSAKLALFFISIYGMCGINGIAFSPRSGRQVNEARLIAMRDILVHRGPDDGGVYIDRNVGLGHRRLSIVDVAHGAQPMFNADRSCTIVYNGEVYNHGDKRKELNQKGHEFQNNSDTETILHLYEEYGSGCVEHLRGMFAFAIWDKQRQELFIARDRFGVKPLYYVHDQDGSLYFASEIKSLIEAGAIKPELNFDVLPDQLANHGTSGDETLFAGVKRLLPGHTLTWCDGRIDIREFWDITFEPKHSARSDGEYVEEWRDLFRESVRLRLMADVPLGMFLSGGIDSSAIAAMMSTMVSEPIKTFSVGFTEREANELEYARLVANSLGTDHREVIVTPTEFFDALPKLVWHEDEPIGFIASVPLYFVSKLAQQHVKVVLTGEGADETLAGYGRYAKALKLLTYGGRYEAATTPFLRAAVRSGVATLPNSLTRKLDRTFLTRDSDIEHLFLDNFAVFPKRMQAEMFTSTTRSRIFDERPFATQNNLLERTDAADVLDKLLYADTKTYLHELLMKQDQMSMAASIESRVPFLDHKLAEFKARMPREMKLRGGTTKWILREAIKGTLPPEILSRPKMGFPVPVGRWFRSEFKHVVNDCVLGPRARERGIFDAAFVRQLVAAHNAGENHDERLWSLVNFEIWQRQFIDGEAVRCQ
jgi:asparagine synthase (glutamine-hydrolysing)